MSEAARRHRAAGVATHPEAFSRDRAGQRRPRQRNRDHLAFIRGLPCLCCGSRQGVQAAHIRAASRAYGKRETGLSEKPGDQWALPLCPTCHQRQHAGDELTFWQRMRIDPFAIACALFVNSSDEDAAELVIKEARR